MTRPKAPATCRGPPRTPRTAQVNPLSARQDGQGAKPRKGQQRPRRLAARDTTTKAGSRRGGHRCSRHSRQANQRELSSAPQPRPDNPARCQPSALTLHFSCNYRHGGSVQPVLLDAANNSREWVEFCGASDRRFSSGVTIGIPRLQTGVDPHVTCPHSPKTRSLERIL